LRCADDYEKNASCWVGSAGIRKSRIGSAPWRIHGQLFLYALRAGGQPPDGQSAVLYFAGFFGLKAEVEGYASQNIFPPGSIRCPSGCTRTAQANLFTGNFGPQIKIRIKRVQPFFEGLVGGAHTNFYQNVHKNCSGCTFGSPGDWALDVVLGGGVDIKITSHLAIRPIEADYFLTRFINNLTTGNNNQNNFRYQAGLVFEF
jgi:hypothetical protein